MSEALARWRAAVSNPRLRQGENDGMFVPVADLRELIALAERAQADPFVPDWDSAPEWAEWHAVDHDGGGNWFREQPKAGGYVWDTAQPYDYSGWAVAPMQGDWRNSLRRRPVIVDGVAD